MGRGKIILSSDLNVVCMYSLNNALQRWKYSTMHEKRARRTLPQNYVTLFAFMRIW